MHLSTSLNTTHAIYPDALAMGVGEFLSSKAENEWILSERRRENWEMENYPEGEIAEMIDIYQERGMTHDDAKLVIETMAKYKEFFVDVMMAEELALQVPDEDHKIESMKEGEFSECRVIGMLCFIVDFIGFECQSDVLRFMLKHFSSLRFATNFRGCNVWCLCYFRFSSFIGIHRHTSFVSITR